MGYGFVKEILDTDSNLKLYQNLIILTTHNSHLKNNIGKHTINIIYIEQY